MVLIHLPGVFLSAQGSEGLGKFLQEFSKKESPVKKACNMERKVIQ